MSQKEINSNFTQKSYFDVEKKMRELKKKKQEYFSHGFKPAISPERRNGKLSDLQSESIMSKSPQTIKQIQGKPKANINNTIQVDLLDESMRQTNPLEQVNQSLPHDIQQFNKPNQEELAILEKKINLLMKNAEQNAKNQEDSQQITEKDKYQEDNYDIHKDYMETDLVEEHNLNLKKNHISY